MKRIRQNSRRGHTLVEVLVALGILTVAGGALALVGMTSGNTFRAEALRTTLDGQARDVISRLTRELRGSNSGSVSALPESPTWDTNLTFDQPAEITLFTSSIIWRTMRLELLYEQGEVNDGADNNGNGLVDEGRIVLRRDWGEAEEVSVTLAHAVREYLEGETLNGLDDNGNGLIDERGLVFERSGDTITVRLTLERFDTQGNPATRSADTSVLLRN